MLLTSAYRNVRAEKLDEVFDSPINFSSFFRIRQADSPVARSTQFKSLVNIHSVTTLDNSVHSVLLFVVVTC